MYFGKSLLDIGVNVIWLIQVFFLSIPQFLFAANNIFLKWQKYMQANDIKKGIV